MSPRPWRPREISSIECGVRTATPVRIDVNSGFSSTVMRFLATVNTEGSINVASHTTNGTTRGAHAAGREAVLQRLADIVGPHHAISDPDRQLPYLHEWRDRYQGRAALVLRPGSTAEVARILGVANEAVIGVVPQGGNTRLVGGQIPSASATEVVLSLARLT